MKDIPGYEGLYAADENGSIVSLLNDRNRRAGELKPYVNTGGYMKVNLYKNGKCKHEYVHRLVALAYLPNPGGKRYVNHIDSNLANNRPENLEWCSARYNIGYSRLQGKQHKDKCVLAFSVLTGEHRVFPNMRSAAVALFGKWYALNYKHKQCGSEFTLGEWRIRHSAFARHMHTRIGKMALGCYKSIRGPYFFLPGSRAQQNKIEENRVLLLTIELYDAIIK